MDCGDVRCILVWRDIWALNTPLGQHATQSISDYLQELVVKDLINPATLTWQLSAVQPFLPSHILSCIQGIPLPHFSKEDTLVCAFTSTRHFTTKSAYRALIRSKLIVNSLCCHGIIFGNFLYQTN